MDPVERPGGPSPAARAADGHAERLSGIAPISRRTPDAPPPPVRPPRLRTRWYLVAAVLLGLLAIFVLPSPFAGLASLASVGAFVTGGVQHINGGDREMVKRTTSSGIIGGGG